MTRDRKYPTLAQARRAGWTIAPSTVQLQAIRDKVYAATKKRRGGLDHRTSSHSSERLAFLRAVHLEFHRELRAQRIYVEGAGAPTPAHPSRAPITGTPQGA